MLCIKKKLWIISFLFSFQALVYGQSQRATDSIYVDSLLKLASLKIDSGYLDQAANIADLAVKQSDLRLGMKHPLTADALQTNGVIKIRLGDYKSAEFHLKACIGSKIAWGGPGNLQLIVTYNALGSLYSDLWQLDEALYYYNLAGSLLEGIADKKPSSLPRLYNNLGIVYSKQGNLAEASKSYQKAIYYYKAYYGNTSPQITSAYLNLAGLLFEQGDYGQSELYYAQILDILYKSGTLEDTRALSFDGLGLIANVRKDYLKAATLFNSAYESMFQYMRGDTLNPSFYTIYNNVGNNFISMKNWALAEKWHQRTIQMLQYNFSGGHPALVSSYTSLGVIAQAKKDFVTAERWFRKAQTTAFQFYLPGNSVIAVPGNQLTRNYELMGNLEAARRVADSTLLLFSDEMGASVDLIQALGNKGTTEFQLWEQGGPNASLEVAAQYTDSAMQVKQRIAGQYTDRNSQIQLADLNYTQTGWAIRIRLALYERDKQAIHFDKAWQYMEQSRSILLTDRLRANKLIDIPGFPEDLAQREYDLRREIYNLQNPLPETGSANDSLAFSAKQKELRAVMDTIQAQFPKIYALRYGQAPLLPQACRDQLDSNQIMLNYFHSDSLAFLLWIRTDTFGYIQIAEAEKLDTLVKQLRFGLTGYHTAPKTAQSPKLYENSVEQYVNAGAKLFDLLIEPVKDKLTPELIIFPDGILNYVPFEALLSKQPTKSSLDKGRLHLFPYLVKNNKVSYCYSATLWEEMKNKLHETPAQKEWIAFAPFSGRALANTKTSSPLSSEFKTLENSAIVVNTIKRLLQKGDIYFRDSATTQQFMKLSPAYRILHLDTHAKAVDKNGEYCFLVFWNNEEGAARIDSIFVRDLYGLILNADMVVLSACETNIGEFQRGEGVISLTRAFAWAGAKSIVATLWQVDDEGSKDLMVDFYTGLKHGKLTKDAALTQAKRKYYENRINEEAHPFFWAGFIGVGDMSALWP